MTRPRLPGLILLLGLLGGGAAANDVVPIAPGERPVPGSTEAELWYGMGRAEAELRALPSLEDDPALNAYVHGVLCRVAGAHCADLRLYLVDDPSFNAAMAPNGATLVFTGALLRLRNESELAFVLGHEFAHYRQRHALQQWERTKRSSAALGTFSLVSLGAGVGLAGSVVQLAGVAGLSNHSRSHEREADALGLTLARAQGYAPDAGAALWARLALEETATAGGRRNPVFATHPKTLERLEDTRRLAEDGGGIAPPPADAGTVSRYREAIAPFLAQWMARELTRRQFGASVLVFDGLHADAPPAWRGLTAFYLAEAHRQRGAEGDAERAHALYAQAVAADESPAQALRELGYAQRAAGDAAGARVSLEGYLQRAPDAPDRAFIERDLKDLP